MTVWIGEGNTPMIPLPRLAARWGLRSLWAKAEYVNPTGSYKDRIATATMAAAVAAGSRGWIATSSGNGGMAMAAAGRRAGLAGVLCVLADAPAEKLASIAPFGVATIPMHDLGPDIMEQLAELAGELRLMLAITAHAFNPLGMVGAQAIGTEIAASDARPSQVYVPTGGGGLAVATARGLTAAGSTAQLVVAQPAGCAPIVEYLDGQVVEPIVGACTTRVSGLQLPVPPDGRLAAEAVRSSDGWGCAVSDEEAWSAQELLAAEEGVFVEPASAVAAAAIERDVRRGRLTGDDSPCMVLTGSGLKDLGRFRGGVDRDAIAADDLAAEVRRRFG